MVLNKKNSYFSANIMMENKDHSLEEPNSKFKKEQQIRI